MKSIAATIAGFILCLVITGTAFSQVGINLTGAPPHTSSILDVSGNTGGFLAPRMLRSERLAIAGPAEGLIVYQTDFEKGYYYFDGNSWILFSEPPYMSPWTVFGDTVYRIVGPDTVMTISEDHLGIGVTNPTVMLDVAEEIRTMWGIKLGYSAETYDNYIWSNQYGLELDNFQAKDIRLMTSTSPGSAYVRMVIKADGKIGVGGTLSPGGLFGLKDSNTYLDVDTEGNLLFTDIHCGTQALVDLMHRHWRAHGDTIYRVVGQDTVMTISEDNVGINNDDPDQRLCVEGGLRIGSGYDEPSRLVNMLYIGDDDYVRIGEWDADDKMSLRAGSFHFEYGNVGIGVVDPQRTLHVNDIIRLEPRATAPSTASMGDMYVRSSDGKLMVYDGSVWQACW